MKGVRPSSRVRYPSVAPGPTLAVLAAAALFGTTGTVLAKGPNGIDPLAAGSLRLLIGGGGLCLVAGRTLVRDLRGDLERRSNTILVGAFAVAVYQLGFFWATQSTGVALATVVTIGTSPLVARLVATRRGRHPPDGWWFASAGGLILGLVLLVVGSSNVDNPIAFDVSGVLVAAIAGAAYATYTEVGSTMISRGWHPTSAMAAMFFGAGILTIPLLATRDVSWFASFRGAIVIAHLSLVTLTVAYVWFGWGLKRLAPTTVVMLTMLEPVIAALLALVVLDEKLSNLSWIGVAIVLVGLLVVGLRSRADAPATVES